MHEMLGNQYFLARKFKEAAGEFEKALLLKPHNSLIKKKLIVCYIKCKDFEIALKVFENLINEDINIVLDSNSEKEDCPCKEIAYDIENSLTDLSEIEKTVSLGMLWLYCDIRKSLSYFQKLSHNNPQNIIYKKVINQISNTLSNNYKENYYGKERYYS